MKPCIVITTHNYTKKFAIPCVDSVIKNTPGDRLILLYDNESDHPMAPQLMTKWEGVEGFRAIRIDDQKAEGGLTGTWNKGVREALEAGCDRIVLLNHDTVVNETWPEFLMAIEDPKIIYGPMSNKPGSPAVHRVQFAERGPVGDELRKASIVNGFCMGLNLTDMTGKWHSKCDKKLPCVFDPRLHFGGNETEFQRRFFRACPGAHARVVEAAWVYHWKNHAWTRKNGTRYEDEF